MLPLDVGDAARLCVKRVRLGDVIWMLVEADDVDCAVGHESTARLVNKILEASARKALAKCERKPVTLRPGDTLITIVIAFRIPEGKVYSFEELAELYEQGKIRFYAVHYGPC